MADFRPLLPPGSSETDVDFAMRLTTEAGVTAIPVSCPERCWMAQLRH